MKNNRVTMGNKLVVDACYSLTYMEKNILVSFLSKIHPKDIVTESTPFTITYKTFANLLDIPEKEAKRELKRVLVKSLYEKTIVFTYLEVGEEVKYYTRWVSECHVGNDRVTIYWCKGVLEHISQIKRDFTSVPLRILLECKSGNTARIFLMLKHEADILHNIFKIDVIKLRKILQIPESYSISDITRRVLLPAKKFINEYTDMEVDFSLVKEGRKVKYVEWNIDYEGLEEKINEKKAIKEKREKIRLGKVEKSKQTKNLLNDNGLVDVTTSGLGDGWEIILKRHRV